MNFDLRKINEIVFGVINGVAYVNTTPHDINFGDSNFITILPKSGILINAKSHKELVNTKEGIKFVKTSFVGEEEEKQKIADIKGAIYKEEDVKLVIIVGSIIAMNAFPGLVSGLVPEPGFERVSPSEKRMSLKEFSMAQI
ncbi:hypothetical protein BFS06_14070 [Clostridium perfringens]|uniref:Uncharacterized protein n=1 Tax=Clostridium perfringens TaxID=1502 RepID=A0A140GRK3_CLOPF|nr:hypothetical protein [Clostridium perfringens]AMN31162.1 hypothetical protein JFP838_pA0246 [Clostridium perfringens]TBX14333.1 hypothetical protein BFS06_14070 [Clostridium perfringens]